MAFSQNISVFETLQSLKGSWPLSTKKWVSKRLHYSVCEIRLRRLSKWVTARTAPCVDSRSRTWKDHLWNKLQITISPAAYKCVFRGNASTHSGRSYPPIPTELIH